MTYVEIEQHVVARSFVFLKFCISISQNVCKAIPAFGNNAAPSNGSLLYYFRVLVLDISNFCFGNKDLSSDSPEPGHFFRFADTDNVYIYSLLDNGESLRDLTLSF